MGDGQKNNSFASPIHRTCATACMNGKKGQTFSQALLMNALDSPLVVLTLTRPEYYGSGVGQRKNSTGRRIDTRDALTVNYVSCVDFHVFFFF